MIKVRLGKHNIIDTGKIKEQLQLEFGIEHVDRAEDADLNVIFHGNMDQSDNKAKENPHVVVIKGDASDLYGGAATLLKDPYCIAGLKGYWRDKWDVPTNDGRHLMYKLSGDSNGIGRIPSKPIYPWIEFLHNPIRMKEAEAKAEEILENGLGDRVEDSIFNGTTEYSQVLTEHRTKCLEIFGGTSGRKFKRQAYIDDMATRSYIPSPWGWGEACWRDWEGMLCGCAVIKPKSDWCKSITGVYQSDRIIWCKSDWSDVNEAIEKAKAMTDEQKMDNLKFALGERKNGYKRMAECINKVVEEKL